MISSIVLYLSFPRIFKVILLSMVNITMFSQLIYAVIFLHQNSYYHMAVA